MTCGSSHPVKSQAAEIVQITGPWRPVVQIETGRCHHVFDKHLICRSFPQPPPIGLISAPLITPFTHPLKGDA
jgi:hypothetical protein